MPPPSANPFAGARFLRSCARLDQLPRDPLPEIAFAGRSNAGKSSALNALCGQHALARVSKTPGRTQWINLFEIPGGRFADLPGYGYAKVSRELQRDWSDLIGRYLETRSNLRGVVLIMDIRHPLAASDRQMLDWLLHRGLPCHLLLTKADKLGFGAAKNTLLAMRRALPQHGAVSMQLFSAHTGLGLDELRSHIEALLTAAPPAHGRTEGS
ncbi:ribosome biogenesis GTP-binding protein YihA/YsxC [Fontimonas thermophila]|nr:ribosome biogenesis GTP-binding protein YihA/YsxC [Fontimonas thermophila]